MSPFFNPGVLEAQWTELEDLFKSDSKLQQLRGQRVLVLCYNGDTARTATSVLRAKGIEADSVKGGSNALEKCFPELKSPAPMRCEFKMAHSKTAVSIAVGEVVE